MTLACEKCGKFVKAKDVTRWRSDENIFEPYPATPVYVPASCIRCKSVTGEKL